MTLRVRWCLWHDFVLSPWEPAVDGLDQPFCENQQYAKNLTVCSRGRRRAYGLHYCRNHEFDLNHWGIPKFISINYRVWAVFIIHLRRYMKKVVTELRMSDNWCYCVFGCFMRFNIYVIYIYIIKCITFRNHISDTLKKSPILFAIAERDFYRFKKNF